VLHLAAAVLVAALLSACPCRPAAGPETTATPPDPDAAPGAAPPGWTWEHPLPQGSQLTAIADDGTSLVAVGARGAAVVSDDAGATWQVAPTGVVADLSAVAGSGGVFHAVGVEGTLLRSLDGGRSFAPRPSPVDAGLVAVAADGAQIYVLAADGHLLRSRDGGDHFAALAGPGGQGRAGVALAVVQGTLLVATQGGILRSDDGGERFTHVPLPVPVQQFFVDAAGTVYAIAAQRVVYRSLHTCGSCVDAGYDLLSLLRSRDAGQSWEERGLGGPGTPSPGWQPPRDPAVPATPPGGSLAAPGPFHPPELSAPWSPGLGAVGAAGELYVAGPLGLLVSTDGGGHFSSHWLDVPAAVLAAPAGAVVVGGRVGTLVRSTDRGRSWRPATRAPLGEPELLAVAVAPSGRAFAVGLDGALAVRAPATGAWRRMPSRVAHRLNDVATPDDQHVIAVGDAGTILQSTDGGRSFVPSASGTHASLFAVWAAGPTVLAAGSEGTLLRSDDGGATWRALPSLRQDAGIALWGSAPDDVYLLTLNGKQLHSRDHGASWTEIGTGLTGVLVGVWGSGPDDVYVVGWGGRIFHTADRGRTWQARPSGTTDDLRAVWGRGADDVWIVAGDHHGPGRLLHSRDRGHTWTPVPIPLDAPIRALGGNADSLLVVGATARILHRPRAAPP
jgi:photosystem II stability/assembly factor-like uncharacterized protein